MVENGPGQVPKRVVHIVRANELPRRGQVVQTLCNQSRVFEGAENVIGDGAAGCPDCRVNACTARGEISFGIV